MMQKLLLALRSLLAMALALVVVVAVNRAGGGLAGLAGFPRGGEARLAWDLGWVCVAGVLATWAAVRLAPVAPRMHAVALFAVFLAVAVAAVMRLGDDWPRWFSAGALLSLPLQVWLGAWWGLRGRRRVP
ncbi:MAG: hypothetical protein ACR2J7_04930 [Luteimonas sp.]